MTNSSLASILVISVQGLSIIPHAVLSITQRKERYQHAHPDEVSVLTKQNGHQYCNSKYEDSSSEKLHYT